MMIPLVASLALAGSFSAQEPAQEPATLAGELHGAVTGGRWWLRLRPRVEFVDQDGFDHDAWASTLRTVLGYETARWHGASVLLEFEDVSAIGNELYNSTTNGETSYPTVADPEGSELNQVHLAWSPEEALTFKLGRQVVTLDNHRFIGDVGWRQNQQTYDAVSLLWAPTAALDVFYAFVDNVNRVFGDDSPAGDHRMASHLVNAGYDVEGWGRAVAYAYLLDYDSVDTSSTSTFGARFAGTHALDSLELLYGAEFASQVEAGDNPNDVDQEYLLAELGGKVGAWTVKLGHEVLGGSGDTGDAFQTPLATLHSFNGWTDKFLVTPDDGLIDSYLTVGAKHDAMAYLLAWHDFSADAGSDTYGSELGASVTWTASKSLTLGLKAAAYDADDFATDTTKAWLWASYAP
jgi:hypothetical protein